MMRWIAFGAFVANMLVGAGVGLGRLHIDRRIHHLLYVLVIASLLAAALLDLMLERSRWIAEAFLLVPLLALPRFRGGSRGHVVWAVVLLAGYVVMLIAH